MVWVTHIEIIKLIRDREAYVFLCINIHTNFVVSAIISSSVITSQNIVKVCTIIHNVTIQC